MDREAWKATVHGFAEELYMIEQLRARAHTHMHLC